MDEPERTHAIDAAPAPVPPPIVPPAPAVSPAALKITMGVIFALWAFMFVAVDYFAWLYGATATLSQAWLTVNRHAWPATLVLALAEGILIRHVSLPGPPAPGPVPGREFFAWGVAWTAAFWAGMYITYLHLWQLPDRD